MSTSNKDKKFIRVLGVTKSYCRGGEGGSNPKLALDRLSLSVKQNEILTILGPNGCGKSTLMRLIAGLDRDFGGSISINGKDPWDARVGFVFQDFDGSLYPWMRNIDNVAFPLELRGVSRQKRRKRVRELLSSLEIDIPEDHYPYQLSGGQKQLLAIARAYANEPEILIFDEPFAHLDFETRFRMQFKLINTVESRPSTVLFVSHDIDEAILLGDRICVLTRSPGSIAQIVDNPTGRHRDRAYLRSNAFVGLRNDVLDALGSEFAK